MKMLRFGICVTIFIIGISNIRSSPIESSLRNLSLEQRQANLRDFNRQKPIANYEINYGGESRNFEPNVSQNQFKVFDHLNQNNQRQLVEEEVEDELKEIATTTTTLRPYKHENLHIRVAPQDPVVHNNLRTRTQSQLRLRPTKSQVNREISHVRIAPQDPNVEQPNYPVGIQVDDEETPARVRFGTEEPPQPAHYTYDSNFQNTIDDNAVKQQETRDGYKVTGSYEYSDGYFHRTVEYIADENGYRVLKETMTPIGDGPVFNPNGKADVSSSLTGGYSITLDDYASHNSKRDQIVKSSRV